MTTRSKSAVEALAKAEIPKLSPEPSAKARRSSVVAVTEGTANVVSERKLRAAAAKASAKVAKSKPKVFCICRGPDVGTPMVRCSDCKDWYHFTCINLSEKDAGEIDIYICPICTERTGRRTVMNWDGPEAIEPIETPIVIAKSEEPAEPEVAEMNESESVGSEDEYMSESAQTPGKRGTKQKPRQVIVSSDESESGSDAKPRKRSTGPVKRKSQGGSTSAPKRSKIDSNPTEDPTRKYCLGKYEEMFVAIYLKYPHVPSDPDPDGNTHMVLLENAPSDEQKGAIEAKAKVFGGEVEQCVYETHAEPDKDGILSAAGKYKERFRMLSFNLNKPDRVVIHKRIASSQISPMELSVMSSADLANEETQQSIKIAEKEALEHSILQKTLIPRAKITHKGLEDIDDIDHDVGVREHDRDRELAEEARRERERTERLRAAQSMQRVTTTATGTAAIGDAQSPVDQSNWQTNTSYSVTANALSIEPDNEGLEMSLTDLINIDEESQEAKRIDEQPLSISVPQQSPAHNEANPKSDADVVSSPARSGFAPRASFDLTSLWSASKEKPGPFTDAKPSDSPLQSTTPPLAEPSDAQMEAFFDDPEADDRDFDMLFEKDDPTTESLPANPPAGAQAAFEALPPVWNGKISMPLDSSIPQETPVIARQVGGRRLNPQSTLWQTLFPSNLLRIDGRVPVDKASPFLLQMRMNASKELVAISLTPGSANDEPGFTTISNFLIGKNRHGLVFPWGLKPKEHHPGKELYIIPLLASEPLPDYMELLDDLRLPKTRTSNILVGIWILNKGKLVPPPLPTTSQGVFNPSPPVAIPGATDASPPQAGTPSSSDLAAEVASLSQDQIQALLRSLAGGVLPPSQPLPGTPPMQPLPHQRYPPAPPQHPNHPPHATSTLGHPSPAWQTPLPGYPTPYPGPGPGPIQRPPYAEGRYDHPPVPPYPPQNHDRMRPYEHRDDRRGQDWRGDRSGRGGRGGGRGQPDVPLKPIDSGWGGARRGGRGGPPGPNGPPRWDDRPRY